MINMCDQLQTFDLFKCMYKRSKLKYIFGRHWFLKINNWIESVRIKKIILSYRFKSSKTFMVEYENYFDAFCKIILQL